MGLNQLIKLDPPEGAIYPNLFKDDKGNAWPDGRTAEQYYYLLKEEQEKQQKEKEDQGKEDEECDNCQGTGKQPQDDGDYGDDGDDGENSDEEVDQEGNAETGKKGTGGDEPCEKCQGSGTQPGENGEYKPSNGNPDLTGREEITLDSHELWDAISDEDEELASQMMEKILEGAAEKSRGNTPGNLEELLALWKRPPVISWKRVLKKFVSSKVGAKTGTIKRRDRRQPRRMDIKGKKTFYDVPEIIVGIDTSGSMSDEEILGGLVEINEVARITGSNLNIVQIDTVIQGMDEYNPKQKKFKRRGCGGTDMSAMMRYLLKEKVKYDVLIMISDMFIEDVSSHEDWQKAKKPTLWLNTSGTEVSWAGLKRHTIMDLAKA